MADFVLVRKPSQSAHSSLARSALSSLSSPPASPVISPSPRGGSLAGSPAPLRHTLSAADVAMSPSPALVPDTTYVAGALCDGGGELDSLIDDILRCTRATRDTVLESLFDLQRHYRACEPALDPTDPRLGFLDQRLSLLRPGTRMRVLSWHDFLYGGGTGAEGFLPVHRFQPEDLVLVREDLRLELVVEASPQAAALRPLHKMVEDLEAFAAGEGCDAYTSRVLRGLASHYRSFVEELCTLPDMGSRLEFLKRRGGGGRAGLAGVGMGYYRIPQAVARQLHGYTNQYDYKTTKLQNSTHNIYAAGGVHFKANLGLGLGEMKPATEAAVYALSRRLFGTTKKDDGSVAGGVVTPSVMLVVSGVEVYQNDIGESQMRKEFNRAMADTAMDVDRVFVDNPHLQDAVTAGTREVTAVVMASRTVVGRTFDDVVRARLARSTAGPPGSTAGGGTIPAAERDGAVAPAVSAAESVPRGGVGNLLEATDADATVAAGAPDSSDATVAAGALESSGGWLNDEAQREAVAGDPGLPCGVSRASLSQHVCLCWLTHPGDGKGANFIVADDGRRLVGIDNDVALDASIGTLSGEPAVLTKHLLLCMDEAMDAEMDAAVRERILRASPACVLARVLQDMQRHDREVRRLRCHGLLGAEDAEELGLAQPALERGGMRMLLSRWMLAQHLLGQRRHEPVTHGALLRVLQPSVAAYYRGLRRRYPGQPLQALAAAYTQGLGGAPEDTLQAGLSDASYIDLANCRAILRAGSAASGAAIDPGAAADAAENAAGASRRTTSSRPCVYTDAARELVLSRGFEASLGLHAPATLLGLVTTMRQLSTVPVKWAPPAAVLDTPAVLDSLLMAGATDEDLLDCWARHVSAPRATGGVSAADATPPLVRVVACSDASVEVRLKQVRWLLARGASPDSPRSDGCTAVDLAGAPADRHGLLAALVAAGARGGSQCAGLVAAFRGSQPGGTVHTAISRLATRNARLAWLLLLDRAFVHVAEEEPLGHAEITGTSLGPRRFSPTLRASLLPALASIAARNAVPQTMLADLPMSLLMRPGLPGLQAAAHALAHAVLRAPWLVPQTELLRWQPPGPNTGGDAVPVLASEAVGGETLRDVLRTRPECLDNLQPAALSRALLFAILSNPGSGGPDHYVVQPVPDGADAVASVAAQPSAMFRLVARGGEEDLFAQGVAYGEGGGAAAVQVRCVLFCLDQMRGPVDAAVRREIQALDTFACLTEWLQACQRVDSGHRCVFGQAGVAEGLRTGVPRTIVGVPLAQGLVRRLAEKTMAMQKLLAASPAASHLELLHACEPLVALQYARVVSQPRLGPLQRFCALEADGFCLDRSQQAGDRKPSFALKMDTVNNVLAGRAVSPAEAVDELRIVHDEFASLERRAREAVDRLVGGDATWLSDLGPAGVEQVLGSLRFADMSLPTQGLFLQALQAPGTCGDCERLHLAELHALTDLHLAKHLDMTRLVELNISGCVNLELTPAALARLASCPGLVVLSACHLPLPISFDVGRSFFSGPKPVHFNALRVLRLSYCAALRDVYLVAPRLVQLDLMANPRLLTVAVQTPLCTPALKGSPGAVLLPSAVTADSPASKVAAAAAVGTSKTVGVRRPPPSAGSHAAGRPEALPTTPKPDTWWAALARRKGPIEEGTHELQAAALAGLPADKRPRVWLKLTAGYELLYKNHHAYQQALEGGGLGGAERPTTAEGVLRREGLGGDEGEAPCEQGLQLAAALSRRGEVSYCGGMDVAWFGLTLEQMVACYRILVCLPHRHPNVSYAPWVPRLCTVFCTVMEETQCFAAVSALLFRGDLVTTSRCEGWMRTQQLEAAAQRCIPDVLDRLYALQGAPEGPRPSSPPAHHHHHHHPLGGAYEEWLFWLPAPTLVRVLDLALIKGGKVVLRVALALLARWGAQSNPGLPMTTVAKSADSPEQLLEEAYTFDFSLSQLSISECPQVAPGTTGEQSHCPDHRPDSEGAAADGVEKPSEANPSASC